MSSPLPRPSSARAQASFAHLLEKFVGSDEIVWVYLAGMDENFMGEVESVDDYTVTLLGGKPEHEDRTVMILAQEQIVGIEFIRRGGPTGGAAEQPESAEDTVSRLASNGYSGVVPNVRGVGTDSGVATYYPVPSVLPGEEVSRLPDSGQVHGVDGS